MSTPRALDGLRVVVTRSRAQNAVLRELLLARGAEVVSFPTIRGVPLSPNTEHRLAIAAPQDFSHLVLTSVNAVRFFARACDELGVDLRAWDGRFVAAVGPATAAACRDHGWPPAHTALGGSGAALAAELLDAGDVDSSSRVLVPGARAGRAELRDALAAAGAHVTALAIYETLPEEPACADAFLAALASSRPPDAVLFASPSAVRAFLELGGAPAREFLGGCTRVVSIGSTTRAALRADGVEPHAVAAVPGDLGMVEALESLARR